MSDIRKLINIISETTAGATASGNVAEISQPMTALRRRSDEDYAAEAADSTPKMPQVLEYGNWENSALTTSKKLKKARSKAKKIVKSIYGEDKPEVDETLHGKQKKLDVNKSGSLDSEDFALLRSKKKVSESRKLASNLAEGRTKQALWDDAEELSLDDFLEKHAKHNDDTEWLTVFWKKTNGVEDDKQDVTEDSIQSLRKQYNSNEHNNYHSENIVLLAKHFGTPQELAMAQKIARYRDKHGGLSYDDPKVAKYLQFQQMINNKYFPLLFSRRGVAEGSDVEYIVVIRDEQGKRSIRVSALTPTDAKEKAEAQGYKVLKVKDPNEKHYFREQGVAEGADKDTLTQAVNLYREFSKKYPHKIAVDMSAEAYNLDPNKLNNYIDHGKYRATAKSDQGVTEDIASTRREVNLKKKIDKGIATPEQKKEYQELKAKNMGRKLDKKQGVAKASSTDKQLAYWDGVAKEKKDKERAALKAKKAEHEKTPVGKAEKYWSKKDVAEGSVHPGDLYNVVIDYFNGGKGYRNAEALRNKAESGVPLNDLVKSLNDFSMKKWGSKLSRSDAIDAVKNIVYPFIIKQKVKEGVAEGDFDQWGGVIKAPGTNWKKGLKQPTSPAKLAKQQDANRQRLKSAKNKEQDVAEAEIMGGLQQDKKLLQDIIDFAKQNGYKVTYRSPQKSWEEVRPGPGVSILYFENNNTELAFYAEVVKKSTRIYIRFGSIDGSFLDDIVFTPKEFLTAFKHAHQKLLDPANRDDSDHPLRSFLDLRLGTIDGRPVRDVIAPKPARIKASNKQGVAEDLQLDEGITDFILKAKDKFLRLKDALSDELAQSKQMWQIVKKGNEASPREINFANNQFKDILKMAGLGAWYTLPIPGNTLLILATEKLLNRYGMSIMPDKIKNQVLNVKEQGVAEGKTNRINEVSPELARRASSVAKSRADALGKISDMGADDPGAQMYLGKSSKFDKYAAQKDAKQKQLDKINKLLDVGMSQAMLQKTAQQYGFDPKLIQTAVAQRTQKSTQPSGSISNVAAEPVQPSQSVSNEPAASGTDDQDLNLNLNLEKGFDTEPAASATPNQTFKHGDKTRAARDMLDTIIDMYANQGISQYEIARKFNIDNRRVGDAIFKTYCNSDKEKYNELKQRHSEARMKKNNTNNTTEPEQAQTISQPTDNTAPAQTSDELNAVFAKLDADEEKIFDEIRKNKRSNHNIISYLVANSLGVSRTTFLEWLKYKLYKMISSGMTYTDASKKTGMSDQRIKDYVDQYIRAQSDPEAARKELFAKLTGKHGVKRGTTEDQIIEIVDMYANRGMSPTEIARQFNLQPPTISYYIKTKYCQNNKNEIDKLKELHSEARRKKLKEPEQAQSISQATDTAATAQPSDELDSTSIDSEYRFAKLDANEEDIFHQMSQGQTTALIAKNLDVTNSTIIEWLRDKVYDMADSGMLITDISKKIGRERSVVTKLIDMYFNTQPDPEAAKKEFNAKRLGKQGTIKRTTQEEMKTYRVVARKKELHLNLPLIKAANVEEARMQAWEMLEERGRNSNDYDVEEVGNQTYKASELPHSGKTPVYKIHDNSGKLLVKYVPHSEKFDYKNKGWFENPLRALRRYGMWYDTATDTVTQYDPLTRKHIKVDPGFKNPIDVTNGMPDRIAPDLTFSSREEVEFDDKTQKYIDDTTKKVTELLTKYPNLLPSEIGRRLGFDPMKKLHPLISEIITDVKRDMNL